MNLALLVDAVVIVLLIVMIGYAIVLNRRLVGLRASRAEMETLLKEFGDASHKAQEAMAAIQSEGRKASESLDRSISKASALSDDLVFLIDRGSKIADGITAASGHKPAKAKTSTKPVPEEPADSGPGAELLKTLQGIR